MEKYILNNLIKEEVECCTIEKLATTEESTQQINTWNALSEDDQILQTKIHSYD